MNKSEIMQKRIKQIRILNLIFYMTKIEVYKRKLKQNKLDEKHLDLK